MVATALMFASCNKDDNHDSGPVGSVVSFKRLLSLGIPVPRT